MSGVETGYDGDMSTGPGAYEAVIEARDLSRSFGKVQAVRSVSFTVGRGEVFGFFGPNGAGKTTTIRLLCGLLKPSSGSASILGFDVEKEPLSVRKHLAIMQEESVFYEKMTVSSYLGFFAKMAGLGGGTRRDRLDMVAGVAEIGGILDKRIRTLSHGQRQKVSLARTFLSDAPVMFLDEPFQGIDIIHRKALRGHLREYVARGNTVFFTSHNLIEAEHIVDRFAFIDSGGILKVGTARELRDRFLLPSYTLRVSDPFRAVQVLRECLPVVECEIRGEDVVLTLEDAADVPRVAMVLGQAGIALLEMTQHGTMEEVFLRMRQSGGGGR